MVDLGEGLDHHVATGSLPFVILFEEHGADHAHDRRLVREGPDDIGAVLDLLVKTFVWVGAVQLGAVLSGEGHVGQNVVLAFVHQFGQLGPSRAELAGDAAPGFARGSAGGLVEGLADSGGNNDVKDDSEARATPEALIVHPNAMPIPPLNEAAIASFSRPNS